MAATKISAEELEELKEAFAKIGKRIVFVVISSCVSERGRLNEELLLVFSTTRPSVRLF